MNLVRLAFRNPYGVVVMALAIGLIGLTTLGRIPVDMLPQFQTPAVQILTLYPGMPTDVVERDITNRLERWTSQANGISRQESRSLIGVSIVKDFFRSDIDPNTAMSQVSSLAISDLYYLPPGTIPPMVMPFDPTASQPLCLLAISSQTLDETELYDIAYFQIRNLLSGTPGVIAPAVYGGRLRRILVYVDRQELQIRGLSLMDVVRALRTQNVLIPTGDAQIGDYDYQIVSNAMVPEVSDLGDIPISFEDGKPLFVRDVGEVRDSYAIQTNAVRIDGRRAVYIPVYRQPGANTIQVVDGIKAAIPGIQARVTSGDQLRLDVIVDQSVFVRRAIAGLAQEGLLGAALAALMVWLFLGGLRATGIIVVALPLSLLCGVIGLYGTGQTLNAMTLGGMALAVGMLMDNGIVVLENVARHLKVGKSAAAAARDGAAEVANPVLVATLTLCVVFVPVTFLTGMGKFLFSPLALAVVSCVAASYVMSMTVVPAACARFLQARETRRGLLEEAFEGLRRGYTRALRLVLRQRSLAAIGILGTFLLSLRLYPLLGQELFPQIDSGQLMVLVRAPSGTRMEKTEEVAQRVEAVIREVIPESDLRMVVTNVGILYDWPAAYTPNAGPHDAFVLVQLKEGRGQSAQEVAVRLRQVLPRRVPGVQLAFDTGGLVSSALNFGLPSPIDVQIEGPDLGVAHRVAQVVRRAMARIPGAVDVRIQQELDYPQLTLEVDRSRAAAVGLTQEDVVQNVVAALNSSITFMPSFWIDHKSGNHYFIGVTYREKDIESRDTIADVPITGRGGAAIPVRNLATMGTAKAAVEVHHVNIRRVIDVYANVQGRDIGAVAREVETLLAQLRPQLPAGYALHQRGEVASMRESFGSLAFGLGLAVVLVYLVLVVQFRSFVDPVIILAAVPGGLIGVLVTLFLTRTTLNIQSLMGVVMMVGLAVAYSVLLVEFANRLRREGMPLEQAIVEAASTRLRPILMTSLAAILGLVPMALHAGEANMPLARAVIGGLSVSALLTLFLVPVLYTYLRRSKPAEEGEDS